MKQNPSLAKIPMGGVFKDAFGLIGQRFGAFALYFAMSVIPFVPMMFLQPGTLGQEKWAWLILFCMVIIAPVQGLWLNNIAVQQYRGLPARGLPERFRSKAMQSIAKGCVLLLGLFAVTVLATIVHGLGQKVGGLGVILTFLSLVGQLFAHAYLGRLLFALVAIAVGEDATFKRSWQMSEGHTGRLALFIIPLIALVDTGDAYTVLQTSGGLALELIHLLAVGLYSTFLIAVYAVWYEKFLRREREIRAATSVVTTAADYGQCQD